MKVTGIFPATTSEITNSLAAPSSTSAALSNGPPHRNGYRERLLTTHVGDLTLAIPKLRQCSFFPNLLEPRRRFDKVLYAVMMEAYTGGLSTRKVEALVLALGGASGISRSEVNRISQGLDEQMKDFLGRPLDHARLPHVYLDSTCLHGRLGRNMQDVSWAVVVVIGNRYAEAQGLQHPRLPGSAGHRCGRQ